MEINYKGYIGKVFFSPDAGAFYGEVLNSEDLIVFQAANPQTIVEAMQMAVDQYLAYLAPISPIIVTNIVLEGTTCNSY